MGWTRAHLPYTHHDMYPWLLVQSWSYLRHTQLICKERFLEKEVSANLVHQHDLQTVISKNNWNFAENSPNLQNYFQNIRNLPHKCTKKVVEVLAKLQKGFPVSFNQLWQKLLSFWRKIFFNHDPLWKIQNVKKKTGVIENFYFYL